MEVLIERGASKADCCQKIVEKHGVFFNVLEEKRFPSKLFGIIPEQVEVKYVLNPYYMYNAGGDRRISAKAAQNMQAAPGIPPEPPLAPPPYKRDSSAADATIDFVEKKRQLIMAAGKDPEQIMQKAQEQDASQQQIIEKLNEIQKKMESPKKPDHPGLNRITEILKLNDFSDNYITRMLERARKEIPLDTLEDFNLLQNRILEWIGESIGVYNVQERAEYEMFASIRAARIMTLIGPTGVGKTTTIAKLAAIYGITSERPVSVRIITIDAFRIGAKSQIEKYGEIMEVPISYVDNQRDLRKEIDLYSEETDLILIDTIGRSPRDPAKLGEMKELLDVCGSRAEMHLVISASTSTSNIENILRQFEPFNYQAVLLTKFDESIHIGNIISVLAEKEKPLSYITVGQNVPKDIRKANVIKFLTNLEGFRVDRDEMEKRFPAPEADQFLWG